MEKASIKKPCSKWRSEEVIAGIGIVVFSVTILLQVPGSYGNVMLFPSIVGGISLLSGLFMIVTGLLSSKTDAGGSFIQEIFGIGISAFIFLSMTYVVKAGFYFSLFVISFAVNQLIAFFCMEKGAKTIFVSFVLAVLMTGVVYLVFGILLGIITPAGIFI